MTTKSSSLEERLSARFSAGPSTFSQETQEAIVNSIKSAFSVSHINPRQDYSLMPYLKYDLVEAIIGFLTKNGADLDENFCNKLYKINKEPLKRVYYGMLSTGNLPSEFLNSLTDWEKIYFFAGRWCKRDHPFLVNNFNIELKNGEELYLFVSDYLLAGINLLKKVHREKYNCEVLLPEEKKVVKECLIIKRTYSQRCASRKANEKQLGTPRKERERLCQVNLFGESEIVI